MYPFGYGLNYSEFEYSDIAVEKEALSLSEVLDGKTFDVTVKVRNVGTLASKEVVQCYIKDCYASMVRPLKELKGFDKQEYKPGEVKTITFKVGFKELGFYGQNGKYVVEPGEFNIFVGKDCMCEKHVTVSITK